MGAQQSDAHAAIEAVEARIAELESCVERGKESVQGWVDASNDLSQSAAEARAKNQAMGRGFGGALLGSKYRAAMRRAAASSNAAIAQELAEKRARLKGGKRAAQEYVKGLRAELSEAKATLRRLKAESREVRTGKSMAAGAADSSFTLLKKLKEAHELGLLTDEEYEQKRLKLVDSI